MVTKEAGVGPATSGRLIRGLCPVHGALSLSQEENEVYALLTRLELLFSRTIIQDWALTFEREDCRSVRDPSGFHTPYISGSESFFFCGYGPPFRSENSRGPSYGR